MKASLRVDVSSHSVRHDENLVTTPLFPLDAEVLLDDELVASNDVLVVLVLVEELFRLDHPRHRNVLFFQLLGKTVVFHQGRYLHKVVLDAQPPAHGIVILKCYK